MSNAAVKTVALVPNALSGKCAFITGGGTGLGKGMAKIFSALGAQVAIASRRQNVLEEAAAEIEQCSGNKVIPIQMNVRQPEDVTRAADAFVASFGRLPNIIVNNAAGNFISPTERLSANAFRTIVDTVLMGTAYVTLEFGKRLIKEKQGILPLFDGEAHLYAINTTMRLSVNHCSIEAVFLSITTPYARTGSPFVVPSAASKAGVENITRSLAAEWGKHGIRLNAIAPGPIRTEGAFSRLDPTGQFEQHMLERLPLGRTGEVDELANLAAFMVSDQANWMTGSVIDFDGGQLPMLSGAFSGLHVVTNEQWDMMESIIRKGNEKSKKSKL